MEAEEERRRGLLHQIIPPRLEDAGLEDCALPPDAIKAAFLKAATAVKSRAAGIFSSDDEGDDCVADPWPEAGDQYDVVDGGLAEAGDDPGSCVAVKGLGDDGDDAVVVGGGEEAETGHDVVAGRKKDCVDGLQGLEIGEKKKNGDEEEEEERPILVGGYV